MVAQRQGLDLRGVERPAMVEFGMVQQRNGIVKNRIDLQWYCEVKMKDGIARQRHSSVMQWQRRGRRSRERQRHSAECVDAQRYCVAMT